LEANTFYPVLLLYSNVGGPWRLTFSITPPGGTSTTNGSGYFYNYNNSPVYFQQSTGINTLTANSGWVQKLVPFLIYNSGNYSFSFLFSNTAMSTNITMLLTGISLNAITNTNTSFISTANYFSLSTNFNSSIMPSTNTALAVSTNYTGTSSSLITNWNIISTNTKNILIINGIDGSYNTVAMPSVMQNQCLGIQMNSSSSILLSQPITIQSAGYYTLSYYLQPSSSGYNGNQTITTSFSNSTRTDILTPVEGWNYTWLNLNINEPGTYTLSITIANVSASTNDSTILIGGIAIYSSSYFYSNILNTNTNYQNYSNLTNIISNSSFTTPTEKILAASLIKNYTGTTDLLIPSWSVSSNNTKNVLLITGIDGSYNAFNMPSGINNALAIEMNTNSSFSISQIINISNVGNYILYYYAQGSNYNTNQTLTISITNEVETISKNDIFISGNGWQYIMFNFSVFTSGSYTLTATFTNTGTFNSTILLSEFSLMYLNYINNLQNSNSISLSSLNNTYNHAAWTIDSSGNWTIYMNSNMVY
jgi:hypothetical protein